MDINFKNSCVTIFSWNTLKVIGASKFATVASLLPIVGYLLIFNEYAVSLVEGFEAILNQVTNNKSPQEVGDTQLLHSTKLKLMYLGLWAIGFATLSFRLICPKIIRDYKDEREFIEANVAVSNSSYYRNLLTSIKRKIWYQFAIKGFDDISVITINQQPTSATALARGVENLPRAEWLEKNSDGLNLAYGVKYQIMDYSLLIVRLPIFILFAFGFIATLWPSIEVFLKVLSSLF